jgi:hypothetical protein
MDRDLTRGTIFLTTGQRIDFEGVNVTTINDLLSRLGEEPTPMKFELAAGYHNVGAIPRELTVSQVPTRSAPRSMRLVNEWDDGGRKAPNCWDVVPSMIASVVWSYDEPNYQQVNEDGTE